MNSTIYFQGKELKSLIENKTNSQVDINHLVVALILAAKEQGLTMEELVHLLILAKDYEGQPVDKAKNLRELGY